MICMFRRAVACTHEATAAQEDERGLYSSLRAVDSSLACKSECACVHAHVSVPLNNRIAQSNALHRECHKARLDMWIITF